MNERNEDRPPAGPNELMTDAANALAATDGDAFDYLHAVNDGWIQNVSDHAAMKRLLDVMQKAAYIND
jgi:hypothetical protein|tara:strand:+ start:24464 stop:24667 length:204 start_codon:yes stop_codon:yes gene_type:complete